LLTAGTYLTPSLSSLSHPLTPLSPLLLVPYYLTPSLSSSHTHISHMCIRVLRRYTSYTLLIRLACCALSLSPAACPVLHFHMISVEVYTHTRTHTLSHTQRNRERHTHEHTLAHTLLGTTLTQRIYAHTRRARALTQTRTPDTHTLTHSHTQTHTHTHTHKHTHTHTHTHTHYTGLQGHGERLPSRRF